MDKIYPASNDLVFKALFVNYPDLLKSFLRDNLDLPITDSSEIVVLNQELLPEKADGKLSRLDIHVITEDKKFNIEMQARGHGFSPERVLYYWSKMYSGDLSSGKEYEKLQQCFSVVVLDFNYLDCEEFHSDYMLLERKRYEPFTDKLSIHLFELPKIPKNIDYSDIKQLWMMLLKAKTKEELDMLRTNTTNNSIQNGVDAIYKLNADTILREQIRQREKDIADYNNDMAVAEAKGAILAKVKIATSLLKEGRAIDDVLNLVELDRETYEKFKNAE